MTAHIDRAGHERADPGLLARVRAEASTRVLIVVGDRAPLASPDALLLVAPADVPADAAAEAEWAFLGRDRAGAALVVAALPAADSHPALDAAVEWAGLRVAGGALAPDETELFAEALSLGRWLVDAPFCPACGTRTELGSAGWSRTCPACGREHFPRTDPAVIVAVTGSRHPDRLLLGSNAMWGAQRYSCFAGFAEAGESLEDAVRREVREEAGVEVTQLRYQGSQPWPYPRSLMVGFIATAADDDAARPDGEEIVAVRWFTRDEIGEALEGRGDVQLPGRASIAHRLISRWHAEVS